VNKKELITRVQRYMGPGATRRTASAAVEAVLSSILLEAQREKLHISHFGTFETTERKARSGTNPANGAPLHIEAHTRLIFRPAKELSKTFSGSISE